MPAPTGVDISIYISNQIVNFVDTALKVYRIGDSLVAERERQLGVAQFVSAESAPDGKAIYLMFSKNMKAPTTEVITQFTVQVKTSDVPDPAAPKNLELSDTAGDFKLKDKQESALEIAFKDNFQIFENDVVEIAYAQSGTETEHIKDSEDKDIENFSEKPVVNPIMGPKIKSARTAPNGLKILVVFDKKMKDPENDMPDAEWKYFKIQAKKGAATTDIVGTGAAFKAGHEPILLEITLDKKIENDQTATLTYELPVNPDNPITHGIYADDDTLLWKTAKPIEVKNEAVEPPIISEAKTSEDGEHILVKFNKPMKSPVPATTEWSSFKVNASEDITINGGSIFANDTTNQTIQIDIDSKVINHEITGIELYYELPDDPTEKGIISEDDGVLAAIEGTNAIPVTNVAPKPPTAGDATEIGARGAKLNGEITDLGYATEAEVIFEYSKTTGEPYDETPTDPQNITEPKTFEAVLTSLDPTTEYFFRAKATINGEDLYSEEKSFTTTAPEAPTVTTGDATNVGSAEATLNGELTNPGSAPEVTVSFEWGDASGGPYDKPAPDPQTIDSAASEKTFSAQVTELEPGKEYFFRAKAEGDGDTAFGAENTFTPTGEPPRTEGRAVSNIGIDSAQLNGELMDMGTATEVEVYFEWGIKSGEYQETTKQILKERKKFNVTIEGLNEDTKYFYRTVAVGHTTFHGNEHGFTTKKRPPPEDEMEKVDEGEPVEEEKPKEEPVEEEPVEEEPVEEEPVEEEPVEEEPVEEDKPEDEPVKKPEDEPDEDEPVSDDEEEEDDERVAVLQ
jgi:hypothetical protein